jgi:hypothetical protein
MTGSPRPDGNGLPPSGPTFYRIVCPCGAALKVRGAKAGRMCRCPRCARRHPLADLPAAPSQVPGVLPVAEGKAEADKCSACYTLIQPEEERHTCPACTLHYHADCWEQNLGCAAYGCSQVNVLKKGPDHSIPADVPGGREVSEVVEAIPVYADRPGMPWHFLFLALSIASGFLSLLMCGAPSLLVGAATVFYTVAASQRQQLVWLIPALILSLLGFLLGVVVSAMIYLG